MRKRYILSVVAMMLLPLMAGAQALKGSYFLDNSLQRHRLNPAFAPRANYFSVPVISNVGLGVYGNVGPADFLYPKNGELYTFLNQNVTMEEFSKNLPARPVVDLDVDTDIFNFGFSALGGFWTVDAGIRVDGQIGLPRDFLIFAKQGMAASEQRYSLKGFDMYQTSSIYAAIGHSRDLSFLVDGLRVGGKLRFFLPVEHIGLTMGDSYLSMSQDKWTVNSSASGVIAASFLEVNPEALNGDSEQEFLNVNTSSIGPAGFGFSVDLGAEYKLNVGSIVDGLTFSLSALDLGGYFFGKNKVQGLESKGTAVYEGIKDIEMGSEGVNMEESLDALKDEFLALAILQESADPMYSSVGTGAKIYAGVEYPFLHDMMSVGLLYSGKFGYSKMINDLTVSYNLNPCKWFNFGLNWSFLNSYKTMGWIIEFTPKKGVDFFIGSDYTFFEVMPKVFLPVDKLWVNARFGLSFMIGGGKN